FHHIVFDGWSVTVLLRELCVLYEAAGRSSSLPPLPMQYPDFALWQRQRMQDQLLSDQLPYWQKQLNGVPRVLRLPTDRPRPPVQSIDGASLAIQVPLPLTQALKRLSQKEGATLFMTLLAAFYVLLCRYTGQADLAVGTPIANRHRSE